MPLMKLGTAAAGACSLMPFHWVWLNRRLSAGRTDSDAALASMRSCCGAQSETLLDLGKKYKEVVLKLKYSKEEEQEVLLLGDCAEI